MKYLFLLYFCVFIILTHEILCYMSYCSGFWLKLIQIILYLVFEFVKLIVVFCKLLVSDLARIPSCIFLPFSAYKYLSVAPLVSAANVEGFKVTANLNDSRGKGTPTFYQLQYRERTHKVLVLIDVYL